MLDWTPEQEADMTRRMRQQEADYKARRLSDLNGNFNCGPRLRHATFAGYRFTTPEQQTVVESAREYAETLPERLKDGQGAVFYGPSGTGKDHLAVAICRYAIDTFMYSAQWVYGLDYFGELRSAIGADRDERHVLNEYVAPTLLVLSDPLPPTGELTSYQGEMLARLVEHRNRERKLTLVTLNVKDGETAVKRMGAATWSRLRHGAWVFPCNWSDFRKPAKVVGKE